MARPTKQGIDYFPVDVQFDDKTELFITETGAEGLGVLITVWQIIYQNEGYYTNYCDDLFLLIKKKVLLDVDKSRMFVDMMIKRKIFSPEMFRDYGILTSNAVQNRYAIASKKKKTVSINPKYVLNGVFDAENVSYLGINSAGNSLKEDVKEKVNVKEEVKVKRDSFSSEEIEKLFKEKTKIQKPELEKHIDPILAILEEPVPEHLKIADIKKAITDAFNSLDPKKGVRVDFLCENIRKEIAKKRESVLGRINAATKKEEVEEVTDSEFAKVQIAEAKELYKKHEELYSTKEKSTIENYLTKNDWVMALSLINSKIEAVI